MRFTTTALQGVVIVDVEPQSDERGLFARTFCSDEFADHGLPTEFVQCNASFNLRRGTLRGMHFQLAPHEEGKLVRCTAGALSDVALDLRPESPTRLQWLSVELTAENRRALYIPGGCAHGFQTLADNTEVFYQMTAPFTPEAAAGVRWNDRAFGIAWPIGAPVISERDASYPDYIP